MGRAVDLIRHEPVYAEVFRYVFGDTLVFANLANARRELGRCRAVTLDGELLEKSGAMTGGSLQQRSGQLGFGRSSEGDEAEPLRRRLLELGESLLACRRREAELGRSLEDARPALQALQQRQAALEAERDAAQRTLAPRAQRRDQLAERLRQLQDSHRADRLRMETLDQPCLPCGRRWRNWRRRSAPPAATTTAPAGRGCRTSWSRPIRPWSRPAGSATPCWPTGANGPWPPSGWAASWRPSPPRRDAWSRRSRTW